MKPIAKQKSKSSAEPEQTAEDYFAEIDLEFNRNVSALARFLEWKEATVAGFIFESLKVPFWRGYTPPEIAEIQLYWQQNFYNSRRQRREGFLANALREK